MVIRCYEMRQEVENRGTEIKKEINEIRDFYSTALANYWNDINLYEDQKVIPRYWLRRWTNQSWLDAACHDLFLRNVSKGHEANPWKPDSIEIRTDCRNIES